MYKIFHENKTLVFPKINGDALVFDAKTQESDRYDADLLCEFLSEWLAEKDESDTFIHEVGENAVADALKSTFKMTPAAGGIVVKDGKFVAIVRNGIPDLPKGHIEKGETPESAALREVEEETGIDKLQIVKELPSTWHCYLENESWILKRTYWYLMQTESEARPQPQAEEGITEAKPIGNTDIDAFLGETFRSISEILGEDLRQVTAKS